MRSYSRYDQPTHLPNDLKVTAPLKVSFSNARDRNPSADLLKLPALNSLRRSGSIAATERNTKFKLENLEDKIQQLAAGVHNTRLDAQETLGHIRLLKESLASAEVSRIREDLKKQAKGLERIVRATISADEERFAVVKKDCQNLWDATQNMRQTLFQLKMRVDSLDRSMGFKDSTSRNGIENNLYR